MSYIEQQKITDGKFEKDFMSYLSSLGYWVTFLEGGNHTGSQACDCIACKDGKVWAIDCKTLNNKNGLFPLERIEQNQVLAYKKFKKCGNENFFLAILWNNNIYFIPMSDILFEDKSIDLKKKIAMWRGFYAN